MPRHSSPSHPCSLFLHLPISSASPNSSSSRPTSFSNTNQFASGSQVTSDITKALEACPADAYILVKQPQVSVKDFSSQSATPFLRRRMTANESTSYHASIPEVLGDVDVKTLQQILQEKCGASLIEVDASRMSNQ